MKKKKKNKIRKKLISIHASEFTRILLQHLMGVFGFRTRSKLMKFLSLNAAVRITKLSRPAGMTKSQAISYNRLKKLVKEAETDREFSGLILKNQ